MKTAKRIRKLEGFTGEAWLYKVNPAMKFNDTEKTNFVVSSAAIATFSGPETLIFPANKKGKIIHWGELNGSGRGFLNCDKAIKRAKYKII